MYIILRIIYIYLYSIIYIVLFVLSIYIFTCKVNTFSSMILYLTN